MKLIAPSVLSADFGHLADDLEMINRSEADWLHVDVMQAKFRNGWLRRLNDFKFEP